MIRQIVEFAHFVILVHDSVEADFIEVNPEILCQLVKMFELGIASVIAEQD